MAGLLHGKFIDDGTITPAKVDFSSASSPTQPATRQYVTDYVTAQINLRGSKDPVRLATTGAISASGLSAIDGVTPVAGNRILRKNESTASLNGIWIAAAGAWTRATDYDESAEIIPGHLLVVQEGTTNADKVFELSTDGPITIGTTALSFQVFSSSYYATPTVSNKNMQCSVTTADGDAACATGLVSAPATNSYVRVFMGGINGKLAIDYGNAVKTGIGYFSADAGTTAKAHNALASGDKFYWNQSVAGFNLAATDYISFDYAV